MDTLINKTKFSRRVLMRCAAGLGLALPFALERSVPAAAWVDASPVAGVQPEIQILLERDISKTLLPDPTYGFFTLHIVLPPASSHTWLHENKGLLLAAVDRGTLEFTAEERVDVLRANGTIETIGTNGEETVTIEPGDSLMEYEFLAPRTYANTGTEPVHVYSTEFNRLRPNETNDQYLAHEGDWMDIPQAAQFFSDDWEPYGLSGTDLHVVFRRLAFAPGATYTVPGDLVALQFVDEGALELVTTMADGRVIQPRRMVGSIYMAPAGEMTEAVFTNRDATPAVMIELLLTPIDREPATPSA